MSSFTHGCMNVRPSALDDRCAQRVSVNIAATLRASGAKGFHIVLKDISVAGFSCEAVTTMRTGAVCWLTIPGLEGLQAEVAWNNGIMVGCGFSRLLHPSVLDRIKARSRPVDQAAMSW
jgi:hypothetical protein